MKQIITLLLLVLCPCLMMASEGPIGKWKTIDDVTGEVKSIVEIVNQDGKLFGTIVKLFNKDPDYDPTCNQCKDDLKGTKIIGMQIIKGLELKEGRWCGKKGILDPDNGKYYDVKLWLDPVDNDRLLVRGYISFLFRTQVWLREE
jgi:uncharacterized protein (DUF2147 family)